MAGSAAEPAAPVKIAETERQTASDALTPTQAAMTPHRPEGIARPAQPAAAAGADRRAAAKPTLPSRAARNPPPPREASDLVDPQTPSRTADRHRRRSAPPRADAPKGGRASAEAREMPRMSEPVSVFVSRKAGRLYVRQGYEPVFDAPVTIQDPDAPIGTHLYTALDFTEDRTTMRWNARHAAEPHRERRAGAPRGETKDQRNAREEQAARAARTTRPSPSAALDRIEMPQDAVDRIAEMMSPGSSLIISDYPISGETGKYTDFIVLTR